jgi:hypothetical protein
MQLCPPTVMGIARCQLLEDKRIIEDGEIVDPLGGETVRPTQMQCAAHLGGGGVPLGVRRLNSMSRRSRA